MVQVALLINDERRGQFHFEVVVVVKSFALLVFFLDSTVAGGGGGGRVQFSITYTLVVTHPIVMGMIISISVGLFFSFIFFPVFPFLRTDRLWESWLARIPHMDYSTERDQWAVLSRTREITCTASKVWLVAPTILSLVSLNRRSSFTSDYRSSRWSIPIELPAGLL